MKKMLFTSFLIMILASISAMAQFYSPVNIIWYRGLLNTGFINAEVSNDGKYLVLINPVTQPKGCREVSQIFSTDSLKEIMWWSECFYFMGFTNDNKGIVYNDYQIKKYDLVNKTWTGIPADFIKGINEPYLMNYYNPTTPAKFSASANMNKIIAIRDWHTTDLYDLVSMTRPQVIKHPNTYGNLYQVALSPDGLLVAYGYKNAIEIHDLASGELLQRIMSPSDSLNTKLLFSPMGNMIINFIFDRGVETFKVADGSSLSFINYKFYDMLDYVFFPDYERLLFNGNKIFDLRNWSIYDFNQPGYEKVCIIDGKLCFLSIEDNQIFLRDLDGKVIKVLLARNDVVGIDDATDQALFLSHTPLTSAFQMIDVKDGSIKGVKRCDSVDFVGYVRETGQYYTIDTVNSNICVSLYDFATNRLDAVDTIQDYGKFKKINFYKGNKYIQIDTVNFYDRAQRKFVNRFTDPTLCMYTIKDTIINYSAYHYVINVMTGDTFTVSGIYKCQLANYDHYLLIQQNMNYNADNCLWVVNLSTRDTVKVFHGHDSLEVGIKSFQVHQDRFLQVIYWGQTNKLYDMGTDSLIASWYPEDIFQTFDLYYFTKDFKYAVGSFTREGNSQKINFSGYRTNLNYIPGEVVTGIPARRETAGIETWVYPNPALTQTTINYALGTGTNVTIRLVDLRGNETVLASGIEATAGINQYSMDASSLPAGMYFYKVQAGMASASGKILVVK